MTINPKSLKNLKSGSNKRPEAIRVTVWLNPETIELAKHLGDGKTTRGLDKMAEIISDWIHVDYENKMAELIKTGNLKVSPYDHQEIKSKQIVPNPKMLKPGDIILGERNIQYQFIIRLSCQTCVIQELKTEDYTDKPSYEVLNYRKESHKKYFKKYEEEFERHFRESLETKAE